MTELLQKWATDENGRRLFGGPKVSLSLSQMVEMFRSDSQPLHVLGRLGVQAVAAWSVVVPPVGVVGTGCWCGG